ncbi:MAG: ABC transporter ATP-binding protein [Promethearchaeota archaeon]
MEKQRIIDNQNDKQRNKMKTLHIIRQLFKYVGETNRNYILSLGFLIITNVIISWFIPLVFKALVDDGLGGGIGSTSGNIDLIRFLGVLFFILTIISVLIRIAQGYIIQKLATLTMYNLRYELFNKFQKLGLDYHENPERTTGEKISYLTNDVDTIQELLQSGLLKIIGNFFLILGALGFMIFLSPQLTLVSFMVIPLIGVISWGVTKKARKYFKELRKSVAKVTSELDESIRGMRVIKAFAVEEENFKEFNNATDLVRITTLKSARLTAFIPGIVMFLITTGLTILILMAGILIREGMITQGTLVAFTFYVFMFYEPILSLSNFFSLIQNSISASERIIQVLNESISIQDEPHAIELTNIKGIIEFQNVKFEYELNKPILTNFSMTIKEKERLAIVGYTGAGKSTIIKLLSRFYDPNEGVIKIDELNLKDVKVKSLRTNIGIVLQENFLFSGTVMENIRYGKLDANDEDIIEAAKMIRAHDMIMDLEEGYETIVEEKGRNFSEGQRQLICFARAILKNPPILILDEATSSIDPYNEILIQEALQTLLKGRTSISIAHRLSTIINSDRVIVLDKGKIVEEGSHQELIKKNGLYKYFYKMQFKDPFKNNI